MKNHVLTLGGNNNVIQERNRIMFHMGPAVNNIYTIKCNTGQFSNQKFCFHYIGKSRKGEIHLVAR